MRTSRRTRSNRCGRAPQRARGPRARSRPRSTSSPSVCELAREDEPVDPAVVDDERDRRVGHRPASDDPRAQRGGGRLPVRRERPGIACGSLVIDGSGPAGHLEARERVRRAACAPTVALLDLSVCAGRTSASASPAATAASMAVEVRGAIGEVGVDRARPTKAVSPSTDARSSDERRFVEDRQIRLGHGHFPFHASLVACRWLTTAARWRAACELRGRIGLLM